MDKLEIIKGLLIYFDNVEIDVMKASRQMGGFKEWKKFENAQEEAYKLIDNS